MRSAFLIALILPLAACATPMSNVQPYAMPNSLMRKEIQSRISQFQYQHGQELLNNMLWLQTKAGETAIVDLLAVLDNADPKVRCSALWVLGRIHDRRVIPRLHKYTADKSEVVRLEAARSLVNMGDLKYVTILIEGLDSDKPSVRYNCHMALKDSTQKDFQYDHLEQDAAVRHVSVLRWREWWARQSADPWFAASYAREHGLPSATLEQVASAPIGETMAPGATTPNTATPDATVPSGKSKTGSSVTTPGANPWAPIQSAPSPTEPPASRPNPKAPKSKVGSATPDATKTDAKKADETATSVFKLLDLEPPAGESEPGKQGAGKDAAGKDAAGKDAAGEDAVRQDGAGKKPTGTAAEAPPAEKTEIPGKVGEPGNTAKSGPVDKTAATGTTDRSGAAQAGPPATGKR